MNDAPTMMSQVAPWPDELARLVGALRFRVHLGWKVWLEDDLQRDKPGRHSGESRGLTLIIQRYGPDSYHPGRSLAVSHYFAVPPATYNRASWMRWLFDRLGDVDAHERMEDFAFEDEVIAPATGRPYRPFAPNHGPGWDPYLVTTERTELDRRTAYTGDVNPE